ncbi:hypothetical protein [uncultured Ruminococcus sp.]|uniref:hypothetical protein n=1 Tax=uncultured Ruminococcus sp. TaxID=165186 RepID=UPI0025CCEC14|nr:hypothetical protein [uncultured Ruminococcus sp.]
MFDDINQIEKEIEEFRNNILASSNLVKGISDLLEVVKNQSNSFSSSSNQLIEKLDNCIKQFKDDHDASLQTLSSNNSIEIEKLHKNLVSDMNNWVSDLDKIKDTIVQCEAATIQKNDEQIKKYVSETDNIIEKTKSLLLSHQDLYFEKLRLTEETIKEYQKTTQNQYNGFIERLGTTNVDQIINEVHDLKKDIQTKFAFLMAGVGAAIVLSIISIIIK